jgi:phosphoglycerate dehydrogenase-like enzyme
VSLLVGPEVPLPARFEVLVSGRPRPEHLEASPRLRLVVIPFAGLPGRTRELLRAYPHLAVHNLHHNAAATAELALGLLLAAARRIVPMDQALRRGDWSPRYDPTGSLLLEGRRAVLLGHGHIGRRLGRSLEALGLEVHVWERRSGPLEALLPRAEVLLICLPLTPATEGLLGDRELALLPPGALLVNVGRGPIVQEEALYRALTAGHLGAAGLDVWYRYPEEEATRSCTPPASVPLHELEQVVVSPHRAGQTEGIEQVRARHLARLLTAAARGEQLPDRVDLEAGY